MASVHMAATQAILGVVASAWSRARGHERVVTSAWSRERVLEVAVEAGREEAQVARVPAVFGGSAPSEGLLKDRIPPLRSCTQIRLAYRLRLDTDLKEAANDLRAVAVRLGVNLVL